MADKVNMFSSGFNSPLVIFEQQRTRWEPCEEPTQMSIQRRPRNMKSVNNSAAMILKGMASKGLSLNQRLELIKK